MTLAAPESAIPISSRTQSVVIIGADALLAAAPATPVQLAHACIAAGYRTVVPASWGDELIAAATLRALEQHGQAPAIQCSCPIVAHRLLAAGGDLRPFLISLVAPPVALARYLRAAHAPARLRITYVGRCPGAADAAIDARVTPDELLAMLTDREILLEEQPRVFDSVIPSDRRRFRSQPGGLPSAESLWSEGGGRSIVEIERDDLPANLAQQLLSGEPVLVDLACALSCVCSGAVGDADADAGRARVCELEPPRARSPVIDEHVPVEFQMTLPASPRSAFDVVAPPQAATSGGVSTPSPASKTPEPDSQPLPQTPQENAGHERKNGGSHSPPPHPGNGLPRRHSPARGVLHPVAGGMPRARDAGGRQLPRAYVGRRRGHARAPGGNTTTAPHASGHVAHTITPPAAAPVVSADEHRERVPERGSSGVGLSATAIPVAQGVATEYMPSVEHTKDRQLPRSPEEDAEARGVRERAVALPVTPRSDTIAERFGASVAPNGDYSLRQLFVFALLIGVIVLVSAGLGVVVGRWLAAH